MTRYHPMFQTPQKVHAHLGYKVGDLPHTEENTKLVLSLPMFAEITEDEQREVAEKLIRIVEKTAALV